MKKAVRPYPTFIFEVVSAVYLRPLPKYKKQTTTTQKKQLQTLVFQENKPEKKKKRDCYVMSILPIFDSFTIKRREKAAKKKRKRTRRKEVETCAPLFLLRRQEKQKQTNKKNNNTHVIRQERQKGRAKTIGFHLPEAMSRPVKRSPSPSTHATTAIDDGQRGGVVGFGGSAPAIGGPRAFHGHTMMNSVPFYNTTASTSVIGNSFGRGSDRGTATKLIGGIGNSMESVMTHTVPPAVAPLRPMSSHQIVNLSVVSNASSASGVGSGAAFLLPKAAERQKLVNGEVVHSPADFFPFALRSETGGGTTGGANTYKEVPSPRTAQLDHKQPTSSASPVNTTASVTGLGAVPSLSPPRIHVVGNKSSALRSMSSRGLSRPSAVGVGAGGGGVSGGVPSPRGQASPQSAKQAPSSPSMNSYQATTSQATQPISQPASVPSGSRVAVGSLGEVAAEGREIAALRELHDQQRLLLIKQQEQYEELLRRHEEAVRFTNGNVMNASAAPQNSALSTQSQSELSAVAADARGAVATSAPSMVNVSHQQQQGIQPLLTSAGTHEANTINGANRPEGQGTIHSTSVADTAAGTAPTALDEANAAAASNVTAEASMSALLSSSETVNGVKLYIPTMLDLQQPTTVGTISDNGTGSGIAINGAGVANPSYLVGEEALSAALRLATEKEESVRGDGGPGGRSATGVHGHTSTMGRESAGRTKGDDAADSKAVFLRQQEAALREAVGSDTPILVDKCPRSGAKKLAVDVIVELKVLDANDERVFWTVRCRLSEPVKIFKSKVVKAAKRFVAMLYLEGRKLDPPEVSLWDCGVRADSILACGCGSSLLARRLMASASMSAPVHNKPATATNAATPPPAAKSVISYSVRQQGGGTTPRANNDGNGKTTVSGRTTAVDALGGGRRLSANSSHQEQQRRASSASAHGGALAGAGHALRKRDASVPSASARDEKAKRGDKKGSAAARWSDPIKDFVEAVSVTNTQRVHHGLVGQQQTVLTDEERRRLADLGINVNIGSQNHLFLSTTLADGGSRSGVEEPHMQRVRYPEGLPQIPTTAIGGGPKDGAGHHKLGNSASSAAVLTTMLGSEGDLHVKENRFNQTAAQQQQQQQIGQQRPILLPDGAVSIPQPSADPLLARYEAYLARQEELKRKILVMSSAAQIGSGHPSDHTHIRGGATTSGGPPFYNNKNSNGNDGNDASVVPSSALALHPRNDTNSSQWLLNNNTNNTSSNYGNPHYSEENHLSPPLWTLGVGQSGRAAALVSENVPNPYHAYNLHRDPNSLYRSRSGSGRDVGEASHVDRLVVNDNDTSTDEERMLAAALRPVPSRTPQSDAYFSAISLSGASSSSFPPATATYSTKTPHTHTITHTIMGAAAMNTAYMNASFSSCTTSPTKPPADVVSTRPPSAASTTTRALLQSPPRRPSTAEPLEGDRSQQLLREVEAYHRLPTHAANNGPPSQPHHFVPHAATEVRNPFPRASFASSTAFAQPLPPLSHGFSAFPPTSGINAEKQFVKVTEALDRVLTLEAQRLEEEAVMVENAAETAAQRVVVGRGGSTDSHGYHNQPSSDGGTMLLPAQHQHYPPAAISSLQHPTSYPLSPFPSHSNTANEYQYQGQGQIGPTGAIPSSQRFAEKYQQQQQTVAAARQALAELDQERARIQRTKEELEKEQQHGVRVVPARVSRNDGRSGAQPPLQQRRITFADETELMTTLAVPSYDAAHIGAPSGLSPLGEGRV